MPHPAPFEEGAGGRSQDFQRMDLPNTGPRGDGCTKATRESRGQVERGLSSFQYKGVATKWPRTKIRVASGALLECNSPT